MSDPLSLGVGDVEAMRPEEAELVLAAWVKARRAELPEALSRSKVKALARIAKRAIYQLRSSGLAVEPASTLAEPVAPLASATEELKGLLSAIEGTGERVAFFGRRISGEFRAYRCIISDEGGILELDGGPARRGAYRDRLGEIAADAHLKVVPVDWPRMKLELGRAMVLNERGSRPLSLESATLLRMLEVDPVDPDWSLPPLEPEDAQAATRAATLAREAELTGWLPSENAIAALANQLVELETSPLVLSDAQKRDQALVKASQAAASYLTPERRRLYGRRLWAMAELFDHDGRAAQANLARAEARLLFHTALPSTFVGAMFTQIIDRRPASPNVAPGGIPSAAAAPSGLVRP